MLGPMPLSTLQILELVAADAAVGALRTYFGVERPEGELPSYTGGRFEFLDGGGDLAEVEDRITPGDLIAVQMLSVRVPRDVALDLLEGPLGRAIAALLADVSTEVELGTAEAAALLAPGGAADRAWRMLKDQDDMGWVTAGKLLARKRPKVIPVYDRVVRCALSTHGLPSFWLWLNDRFGEAGGALPALLRDVRGRAGVPDAVSPARVLDAVVWMRHQASHREVRCLRRQLPAP